MFRVFVDFLLGLYILFDLGGFCLGLFGWLAFFVPLSSQGLVFKVLLWIFVL